jgi:hypothetical protein
MRSVLRVLVLLALVIPAAQLVAEDPPGDTAYCHKCAPGACPDGYTVGATRCTDCPITTCALV